MSKTRQYTHWIFCDESGNLSNANTRYLMGAAVSTWDPATLKKMVIRTRKVNRLPRGAPLHAADLKPKVVTDFLHRIALTPCLTLAVAILDKQWIWNSTRGRDHIYNQFFAYLIQQSILAHSGTANQAVSEIERQTQIVFERRDSYKKYRSGLIAEIQSRTSLEELQVELRDKYDVQWSEMLQIADSIAWSTYQKYEKNNEIFFDIVKDKVQLELMLGIDGQGKMRPISEMNNEKAEADE